MEVLIPTREGTIFEGEKGQAQNMPRHLQRLIYSKKLNRDQHRYGADADEGY